MIESLAGIADESSPPAEDCSNEFNVWARLQRKLSIRGTSAGEMPAGILFYNNRIIAPASL